MLDKFKEAFIRKALPVLLEDLGLDTAVHRCTVDVKCAGDHEVVTLAAEYTGDGEPRFARRVEIVIHDGNWAELAQLAAQGWRKLSKPEPKPRRSR